MLSADELAQLRADQEAAMPESCVISRNTLVSDGHGGHTKTPATIATVACRVNLPGRTPEEQLIAQRAAGQQAYTIVMPAGTNVTEADTLTITFSDGGAVRTYQVIGILRRTFETARRVVSVEQT